MNIPENIKEIIGTISPGEIFIFFTGTILFIAWFFRTSYGTKSLEKSLPRRNNMPVFLPLVLIFAILLSIGLLSSLSLWLFDDLQKWKKVFINEFLNSISGLASIGLILYIVKNYFVRGVKGFGLHIKTIPKDFAGAFLNLLAILPLMNLVLFVTIHISKVISGPDYEIPTHAELQSITENTNLMTRIAIAIGTILVIPFLEEMLFRGLFQTMIRSALYYYKHAAWAAIFITSMFFAMNHENVSHWPILFILGACMGYSYEKSGSLFRPVFIHMMFNASAVISTWLQ